MESALLTLTPETLLSRPTAPTLERAQTAAAVGAVGAAGEVRCVCRESVCAACIEVAGRVGLLFGGKVVVLVDQMRLAERIDSGLVVDLLVPEVGLCLLIVLLVLLVLLLLVEVVAMVAILNWRKWVELRVGQTLSLVVLFRLLVVVEV